MSTRPVPTGSAAAWSGASRPGSTSALGYAWQTGVQTFYAPVPVTAPAAVLRTGTRPATASGPGTVPGSGPARAREAAMARPGIRRLREPGSVPGEHDRQHRHADVRGGHLGGSLPLRDLLLHLGLEAWREATRRSSAGWRRLSLLTGRPSAPSRGRAARSPPTEGEASPCGDRGLDPGHVVTRLMNRFQEFLDGTDPGSWEWPRPIPHLECSRDCMNPAAIVAVAESRGEPDDDAWSEAGTRALSRGVCGRGVRRAVGRGRPGRLARGHRRWVRRKSLRPGSHGRPSPTTPRRFRTPGERSSIPTTSPP